MTFEAGMVRPKGARAKTHPERGDTQGHRSVFATGHIKAHKIEYMPKHVYVKLPSQVAVLSRPKPSRQEENSKPALSAATRHFSISFNRRLSSK